MSFELNKLFTSGAVFAQGKPIPVYGSGDGQIKVTFNGSEKTAEAKDGSWLVTFPLMDFGGPYTLTAEQGTEKIVLSDIYVGEVILFLGQSNMQMKLYETEYPKESYESSDKVRLFTVDRLEDTEYFHEKDGWVKCDKETAGNWSAIGYHVGIELSKNKDIAVGAIACYQGASMIQSWLPVSCKEKQELFVPYEQRHSDYMDYKLWNEDGVLYDAMLKKLFPFPLSRVVYYQGESNTALAEGAVYDKLVLALINELREKLSDKDLPVTIVQIANLDVRNDDEWRAVQKAQLNVPNLTYGVNTVVSADISQTHTIHPTVKYPLAMRILESFT